MIGTTNSAYYALETVSLGKLYPFAGRLFLCLPEENFIFQEEKQMHYSDPTANRALSGINREFSRLEKKAKKLRTLWKEGKITEEDLNKAQSQFTGIYRHVLTHVLNEKEEA